MRKAVVLVAAVVLLTSGTAASADCTRFEGKRTTLSGVIEAFESLDSFGQDFRYFTTEIFVGPSCAVLGVTVTKAKMPAACRRGRKFSADGTLAYAPFDFDDTITLEATSIQCR